MKKTKKGSGVLEMFDAYIKQEFCSDDGSMYTIRVVDKKRTFQIKVCFNGESLIIMSANTLIDLEKTPIPVRIMRNDTPKK